MAVDETSLGGQAVGWSGGRAPGKTVLTGMAVEVLPPSRFGRCRRRPLTEASSASRPPFVTDFVAPGSTVITDGGQGYGGLEQLGYLHQPRRQRAARAGGEAPSVLLPGVHRVASLAKRWRLGTHQGAVDRAHLVSYLNEFVFRFNRRRSHRRGRVLYRLLELAVTHEPVRYKDLVAVQRPRIVPPTPPKASGHPRSLDRLSANRPWRHPVKWRARTFEITGASRLHRVASYGLMGWAAHALRSRALSACPIKTGMRAKNTSIARYTLPETRSRLAT